MSDSVKFFVYGTLKEGGHFAKHFDSARLSSKPARISGFDLYSLGPFPAICDGTGEVVGELHTYSHGDEIIRQFDRIEGYREGSSSNLYNRRKVSVTLDDGTTDEAFIYVFGGEITGQKKIESGVWEL